MGFEKMLKYFFGLMMVLSIIGCSSSKPITYKTYNNSVKNQKKAASASESLRKFKDIPKFSSSKHHMAPGFLFSLYHVSDDKLRGKYRASINGVLRLPYGIKLNVKGKTYKELKSEVLKAYKKFFQKGVRNVSFALKSRSYYVEIRGLVKKPGRYLITKKDNLDNVIDMAGGLNGDLQTDIFTVSLKQKRQAYSISLNEFYQNHVFTDLFTWTGEDTIFIKKQSEFSSNQNLSVVTVMSGVKNPGKSLYRDGENIFYYLNKSGGTQEYIAYKEAYIIRESAKGLEKIQFNLTKMETIPVIEPNDIIMLNSEKTTEFDKGLSRTAQISGILSTIALLILAL